MMPESPTAWLTGSVEEIASSTVPSLRRHVGEPVGGIEPAAAQHVLRDDVGIAGNVFGQVLGQQPRAQIIVAAGGDADHHLDGLALVEVRHRIGRSRRERQLGRNRINEATQDGSWQAPANATPPRPVRR